MNWLDWIGRLAAADAVVFLVVVPVPDHDVTVIARLLRKLQHTVVEVLLECDAADEHTAGQVRPISQARTSLSVQNPPSLPDFEQTVAYR